MTIDIEFSHGKHLHFELALADATRPLHVMMERWRQHRQHRQAEQRARRNLRNSYHAEQTFQNRHARNYMGPYL